MSNSSLYVSLILIRFSVHFIYAIEISLIKCLFPLVSSEADVTLFNFFFFLYYLIFKVALSRRFWWLLMKINLNLFAMRFLINADDYIVLFELTHAQCETTLCGDLQTLTPRLTDECLKRVLLMNILRGESTCTLTI
jgi:hypothetical protein